MNTVIDSPRRRLAILITVGLALMMVVSAVSGLNVALPNLAQETGATQTQLVWIVDSYTVVFAGLLLIAGAWGDRYGRKPALILGLSIFGLGATAAFISTDPTLIIAWRAVMGIGAALVMPTTLSVITTSFPEEQRGRAVGVWVGIAGGGAVIGLFGTGLLLEWFPWNSFFALNIGLAVLSLVGTVAVIPASREPDPPRLDLISGLLSLFAVSGLVLAIIESASQGFAHPLVLSGFVVGLTALVLFIWREARKERPMLDPRLFRIRGFGIGSLSITTQFFAAFGFFFIGMQYLQFVNGYTALGAAVALLPMPLFLLPTARLAPRIADKFGFAYVGSAGLLSIAAGFAVIASVGSNFVYWQFASGVAIFAIGMGLAGTPATTAITSALPYEKQGVASAVNDLSREVGSAIGIAVLGSMLTRSYTNSMEPIVANLPPQLADAASGSIAFVTRIPVDQLGPQGQVLIDSATRAFSDAVSATVLVGAGVLVVVAVIVALFGPRKVPSTLAKSEVQPESS